MGASRISDQILQVLAPAAQHLAALEDVAHEPGFPGWLLPIADSGSTMGIRPQIRP
jgi:hypothetical protein